MHFTIQRLDLLLTTTLSIDHVSSADALVYCVGTIKFLSRTSTARKELARYNCLHIMAQLLTAINKTVRNINLISCTSMFSY